jgi:hypothetical protein
MTDKPFRETTDEELKSEFQKWNTEVEKATARGAALAQAENWRAQCAEILKERGIALELG